MLTAGTAERDHEILEAALLVTGDRGVHQGKHARQELVHTVLLVQVFDHRRILAGQRLEAFFAAGIRQAAAIEYEASAVAALVLRQSLMKREAEYADDEIVGVMREALQFFGCQHTLERTHQRGKLDWQLGLMQKPTKIFKRIGHALEKVDFAFVETPETVSAERLHDADVYVGVEMMEEGLAVDGNKFFEGSKIVKVKLLAKFRRKIGLRVVQQRGNVVLQSTLSAALVIEKIGLAVAQHDVARLKIAIEKIVARGAEKEIRQPAEIFFQGVLVEGNARETQKIIFEIVEVPRDGLPIETGDGIANAVVEVAASFNLKPGENGDDFAIGIDDRWRDAGAGAVLRQEFEQRGVAQILFEISAMIEIFRVDLGHGEIVLSKVLGESEEGGVFFANVVENADGAARAGR